MSLKEHTQKSPKEQLDIAQKRLNQALNKLEEQVKRHVSSAVLIDEIQQQLFDLQATTEELQQEKDIISSELAETKQQYSQLQLAGQGTSKELSASINALESVLKKQALLEVLEG